MSRLIYGVGINDLPRGSVSGINSNGKKVMFKFYRDWVNMLKRCYSKDIDRTYFGCSVSDDWLMLSSFKDWFDINYKKDFQLDKDLFCKGNKQYSKEMCNYVPQYLNKLFCDSGATRGDQPIGVSFDPVTEMYKARVISNSKEVWLGRHKTSVLASNSYKKEKFNSVIRTLRKCKNDINKELSSAIKRRAEKDYL